MDGDLMGMDGLMIIHRREQTTLFPRIQVP